MLDVVRPLALADALTSASLPIPLAARIVAAWGGCAGGGRVPRRRRTVVALDTRSKLRNTPAWAVG